VEVFGAGLAAPFILSVKMQGFDGLKLWKTLWKLKMVKSVEMWI
jgi:hypothetical protein